MSKHYYYKDKTNDKLIINFKFMEMEKNYVSPVVEILEVNVEKGFEGSGDFEIEQP